MAVTTTLHLRVFHRCAVCAIAPCGVCGTAVGKATSKEAWVAQSKVWQHGHDNGQHSQTSTDLLHGHDLQSRVRRGWAMMVAGSVPGEPVTDVGAGDNTWTMPYGWLKLPGYLCIVTDQQHVTHLEGVVRYQVTTYFR